MSQIIPKYAQQILGELNIIKSTLDGVQNNVTKLENGQVKIKSTLGEVENNVIKLKRGQDKIESTLGKVENRQGKIESTLGKVENRQDKIESTLSKVENNVEEITQLFEDDIYHQHQRITRLENIHQLPTLSRVVSSK